MAAGETEQVESPSDALNVKRTEAEAGNGVEGSSTIVDGDEKETGNKSTTPSEESEVATPSVKRPDMNAVKKGDEMKKSKIAIIMAALCVCPTPHRPPSILPCLPQLAPNSLRMCVEDY